jgi:hypothetical protein
MELDYWTPSVSLLNDIDFKKKLLEYKKDEITEAIVNDLEKLLQNDELKKDIKTISETANSLLTWVKAMKNYYNINCIVRPKKATL